MKQRRAELGLSLQGLADRVGCSKAHVWDLEKGHSTNPTLDLALSLCEALQCSLGALIGVDQSQPNFTDDEMALIAAHRQIFNDSK
ncbi:MAG: helix-turn-helix transcriptional regulator [Gammaproteobacteria bacterium]|nr:helix-turn-helix transcriptional regulator [Gammaproteobacteria bacterium]